MVFPAGTKLPVNPEQKGGRIAQGFFTPKADRIPQVQSIPPKRVIPIVFLPGIMGSNLRMSPKRQAKLEKKNNIAWRPDRTLQTYQTRNDSPAERQLRLDRHQTEVDEYDPENNPTGDAAESSYERNDAVSVQFEYRINSAIDSNDAPLLRDDIYGTSPRKMRSHKARERGWGEVYFDSYRRILRMCELQLNTAFYGGSLGEGWQSIVGVDPAKWQAHATPALPVLDEKTLRDAVRGCWFPVHAMGYNWLQSSQLSGTRVATRITALIQKYHDQGFQCEKVIIVTHSMGGLVARAAIHPEMGKIHEKVLGIVHGVMPAIGAGAAYKRIRCGFEGSPDDTVRKILGKTGAEVTAVLANAPGGLELLPSTDYGNGWLQVWHKGKMLISLPKNGDPYQEIYTARDKWYRLLREEWINPAKQEKAGSANTFRLLTGAKRFHNKISETYHDQSYAHYGAAADRLAWHRVVWEIDSDARFSDASDLSVETDFGDGTLDAVDPTCHSPSDMPAPSFRVHLRPPTDAGDQTVPLHSADHQLRSGKFQGVFRQSGYEHQASYNNDAALHSTLYSIVRIALTMKWTR